MGGLDGLPNLYLARGLAREASDGEPILRLTRGPARKASDEMSILRIAQGQLVNNPSLLPRPVSPTERHVPLIRQPLPRYQPDDGSTTAERPMRREVASTPYQPGQDGAGITSHCALVLCPRSALALHYAT